MATVESIKRSSKAKRRSMPENIGRLTNLLEETESSASNIPPTLPPLQSEEKDHHILDLLLNEEFSEVELGLSQPSTPTAGAPGEGSNDNADTNELQRESNGDLQESDELSRLSSGKEEINDVLVSQDVIESLTTVKNVALLALDSLLRQIVSDQTSISTIPNSSNTSRSDPWRRRYSFSHTPISSNKDRESNNLSIESRNSWIRSQLLAGIAHNATILSANGEIQQVEPSSSDIATINTIRRQLDSNSPLVPNDDYSLACTLAALLGYLYRILELCQPQSFQTDVINNGSSSFHIAILQDVTNSDDIYSTLHKEVTTLQNRSASLNLNDNIADERLATWNEIDHLMEIVASLCRDRFNIDPPPRYSCDFDEKDRTSIDPPKYSSLDLDIGSNNEKTQRDLENVISAIDRVYYVAPQLNNQRVELNPRQKKELTAATLSNAIHKLSR
ncbi:2557_t:CDS:2, partial [Acaulospora colombiana]